MATLRELLTNLGCGAVRTHLHSGNAVFTLPSKERGLRGPAAVGDALERAIAEHMALEVRVLVLAGGELRRIAEHNPFHGEEFDPARLLVTFLSGPVDPERLAGIDPAAYAPDQFRAGEREIYVYCPDGVRHSKLTQVLWEKRLGLTGTARNGNTLNKLVALTGLE